MDCRNDSTGYYWILFMVVSEWTHILEPEFTLRKFLLDVRLEGN